MLKELLARYPVLTACEKEIVAARDALISCYKNGGKVLLAGNGGSCADCDHIVGELMKGFLKKRPLSEEKKREMKAAYAVDDAILSSLQVGLPAISLQSLTALNSAFCNDVDPELIYAQAVLGLGKAGDVLIALSTSGNAKNVAAAVAVAKSIGMTVIGMTGAKGGRLREMADYPIPVPETETFKVQELHLPVYHYLCAAVEAHFFDC
ncbi:MAG: SIS domain-containing protein [Ruminococcaceae bacterium]|nr:SIS domain-containing protein [Oscillospiraceae bacterium]